MQVHGLPCPLAPGRAAIAVAATTGAATTGPGAADAAVATTARHRDDGVDRSGERLLG